MEGALAEAEGALVVAQAVGGDAELRVLEADVEAGLAHLAHVQVVVGGELGQLVEEVGEAGRLRFRQVLGVEVAVRPAVEGEGNHGDGPSAEADGGEVLALGVEEVDQARGHVPVAAEIEVLHGVHDEILQAVEGEVRREQVKADHGPVEITEVLVASLSGVDDGIVDVVAEARPQVNPLNEEGEHGSRLAGEP